MLRCFSCLSYLYSLNVEIFYNSPCVFTQLSLASTEIPTEISKAIQNVTSATKEISLLSSKIDHIQHSVADHTHCVKPMVEELQDLVDKIKEIQRYLQYLSCVAKVEDVR